MAKDKKGFILYADLIHVVRKLILKDRENNTNYAGELFYAILMYVNDLELVDINFVVELALEPIKQQLKRDLRNFETVKEKRSEAGKLGAQAKKDKQNVANVNKAKQTSTNEAVIDNDNVKENDIDKDSLYNIDFLLNHYLENEILINAFCKGQKTNKNTVISKLKEFNISLSETDVKMKTWNDYTFHFRNWFKKNKGDTNNGTKPNKPTF